MKNQSSCYSCHVVGFLGIVLITATSSQAQLQTAPQLFTDNSWPAAPTLEYRSLDQEHREFKRTVPFTIGGSTWPQQFSKLEHLIELEVLSSENKYRGQIFYTRGFWDEKSNPPRVISLLTFNSILAQSEKEIYQFSYPEIALWAAGKPTFSPNGQRLVLLNGSAYPERYENFGIDVWNFEKKQVSGAVSQASITKETQPTFYQKVIWSPGSQFLSYLRGGNAVGDSDEWTKPYELYISDTRTQVQRRIATDAGHQWSWTHQGTLLFSYLKPQNIMSVVMGSARPSIYESDTKGSKSVKLFDGGYFAQASPDGQWIAFCDWPGVLTDNPNAPKELKENQQRGLFLFHRPTRRRVFVGDLDLPAGQTPLIQWMPDGKSLFVLESRETGERTLQGKIWKMEIEQQTLNPFAELTISGGEGTPLAGKPGYFTLRGTAPDSSRLYLETVAVTDTDEALVPTPPAMPNTQRTLIAVDAQTGKQTPMAHLTTHIGYDDNWDWHDDSGVNPAFAAAAKVEAKLPLIAILKK